QFLGPIPEAAIVATGSGATGGNGVLGHGAGDQGFGVVGIGTGAQGFGVAGNTDNGVGTGVHGHTTTRVGVLGTSDFTGLAGKFEGNEDVTNVLNTAELLVNGDIIDCGNIHCRESSTITCFDVSLTGGDCAEDFDIENAGHVEPGTVMVIN